MALEADMHHSSHSPQDIEFRHSKNITVCKIEMGVSIFGVSRKKILGKSGKVEEKGVGGLIILARL